MERGAGAGRFVWLGLRRDVDGNAPVLRRLGIDDLPLLSVVDSASERAVALWPGPIGVEEMTAWLDQAERRARGAAPGPADAALLEATRAAAAHGAKKAVPLLREALAAQPAGTAARARALVLLVGALAEADAHEECVATARREVGALPRGLSFAEATMLALRCGASDGIEGKAPAQWARDGMAALLPFAREALALPRLVPLVRCYLYGATEQALERLGRPDEARALAKDWLAAVEAQRAAAPSDAARAAFDTTWDGAKTAVARLGPTK